MARTSRDYDAVFEGVLKFKTLEETELALRRLDRLYREFVVAGDRLGASRAVAEVKKGLRRARMTAKNEKVSEAKRRDKEEAALWFETWLASPEAFWTWLRMRKRVAGS